MVKINTPPDGWLDWNTITLDQKVNILEDKFQFLSSGEANCIMALIDFYKQHKNPESYPTKEELILLIERMKFIPILLDSERIKHLNSILENQNLKIIKIK